MKDLRLGEVTAVMVWHGRNARPTLIAELPAGTPPAAADVDPLAHLLAQGFTRAEDLHEAPGGAAGWSVRIVPRTSSTACTEITDTSGTVARVDAVGLPSGFLGAVESLGWLVLYLGDVGLPALPDDDQEARLSALKTAAHEGRLVGARVPARA